MNKVQKLLIERGYQNPLEKISPLNVPEILNQHLDDATKINIIGDYDCDGFASIYCAMTILQEFGYDVKYYIPHRIDEGYGLSKPVVGRMRECDMIITVDNGTVATEALEICHKMDIVTVVTDHHAADKSIAHICINPNCKSVEDPNYSNLCGAQVIFSVLQGLVREDETAYDYTFHNCLAWVMVATIADMVKIDNRNYKFCDYVLNHLRGESTNTSFNALLDVLKLDHKYLTVDDVGYSIGPTINAVGRMDDMTLAVEAALDEDYESAKKKWEGIVKFNKQRKAVTAEGEDLSKKDESIILDENVIVVKADIHAGVIGIVASRLKEEYGKPAVVFNKDGKASCRSVTGFHIRDALIECSKHLIKYGGHAMAAGLSIRKNKEAAFAKQLNALANSIPLQKERRVIKIKPSKIKDLADSYVYSVWGSGNEKPLLRSRFLIWDIRIIKDTHSALILDSKGITFDAMYFNGLVLESRVQQHCTITYELTLNSFNKNRSHTLVIRSIEYEDD